MSEHQAPLADQEAELERAFGFLIERHRAGVKDDAIPSCTSLVQRKLQCGYNRAACLMEEMEKRFWITAPNNHGDRKIIRKQ